MTGEETAVGTLRRRVVIQSAVTAHDGGGGRTLVWRDVATVWGRIAPLGGREPVQAMRLEGRLGHRITIRYRSGITPDMRVRLGTRVLNIRAVIDPDERRRRLVLICEEGVAT
ncbi:MAG: head-tail adaptor protein [Alphaproteobacteria bacterium]|nr:MAG: head-tail adaptor protein [Alphaproteobacteria bacterium]